MLFEQFYNLFLTESINNIPRKELGMSTSIVDLPDEEPYGFWVDRSGNFLPVDYQGHIDGVTQIEKRARTFFATQGLDYAPIYRYKVLFDIGWARVVLDDFTVHYEMGPGQVATPSQLKFLTILKEMYDKKDVHRDR